MHEAKTRLSELVKAVEDHGETVILQRHGKPVAEIHPCGSVAGRESVERDLAPDPNLAPLVTPGYDPAKPMADDEWPTEMR